MAQTLITFKAGKCELEGKKVKPVQTPGFIYLWIDDEMLHFSWRQRSTASWDPELDLIMFAGDCTFLPYLGKGISVDPSGNNVSPTNGRIFELKFSSSSQSHFFWLQSKSQHTDGNPSWFSKKDLLLGHIVNKLLVSEEADISGDLEALRRGGDGSGSGSAPRGGDDDDAMEDVQELDLQRQPSGGAGADATGGDPREEGEDSRRGGDDGGRAASDDPNTIVQNFLRSLQGGSLRSQTSSRQQESYDKPFTTLPELFNTQTTIPYLKSASPAEIDALCYHLPPSIFLLSQESDDSLSATEPTPEAGRAAIEALSTEQKREIVERVLRSPQLHQSLESLTMALRDGGLPQIGEALGLDVENGGIIPGGSMPVGGGEAVKKFLEGVKRSVEKK